ncbi:MAG TPA: hypothetical protein PK252_08365 [Bacteroidales bacterium]|nr:hypothetical protein [Bacteroidales bacterium]
MRYIVFLLVFLFTAGPIVENIQANTASHALMALASKKRKKPAKKKKKDVKKKKKKKPAPKRKATKKTAKKNRVRYPF